MTKGCNHSLLLFLGTHLPNGREERLNLITEEFDRQLFTRKHNYIHLRLIVFDQRGLTRKQVGGKVLIVLYDSHFSDKKKTIIGLVKIDMNNNVGVIIFKL